MADDESRVRLLRRIEAAQFLTENGFTTSHHWLAQLHSAGKGPELQYYGKWPLYRSDKLLAWAHDQLSAPCTKTPDREEVA